MVVYTKGCDNMKIFIDGDGCPVIKETEALAKKYGLELLIISDYNHNLRSSYGKVIKVSQSSDSADFYIFNKISKGDILVSQDLGLSAMALSKKALCINQDGDFLTNDNIDFLLQNRHISSKLRREQKIYSKIKKREAYQDSLFSKNLKTLIEENI